MRFTQAEKMELIQIVRESELGVNRTLKELGIHKSTFYQWYGNYKDHGYHGLAPNKRALNSQWNKIHDQHRQKVVEVAPAANKY
jgi:transposase-like protein